MSKEPVKCEKCGSSRMAHYRCDSDWGGDFTLINDMSQYLPDDLDMEGYDVEIDICLSCGAYQ